MTDNEKIILIMKYTNEAETHLKNEYIDIVNSFVICPKTRAEDVLKVFRAKIRFEAFHEYSANIERILYGR